MCCNMIVVTICIPLAAPVMCGTVHRLGASGTHRDAIFNPSPTNSARYVASSPRISCRSHCSNRMLRLGGGAVQGFMVGIPRTMAGGKTTTCCVEDVDLSGYLGVWVLQELEVNVWCSDDVLDWYRIRLLWTVFVESAWSLRMSSSSHQRCLQIFAGASSTSGGAKSPASLLDLLRAILYA